MLISALAILVFIAPIADEIYIAYRFAKLCEDAGIAVVRRVRADGFYDDTMPSGYGLIEQYGYRFMEHRSDRDGKVVHIEKLGSDWRKTILERPTARYHYKRIVDYRDIDGRIHHEMPVDLRIQMTGWMIVDTETREVIARNVTYMRYPGWIESLWLGFVGTSQRSCTDKAAVSPESLHSASLRSLHYFVFIRQNDN